METPKQATDGTTRLIILMKPSAPPEDSSPNDADVPTAMDCLKSIETFNKIF